MLPPYSLEQAIEKTVREEWGRILACLVKTLGDFQLAEDSLQDALEAALVHWKKNGLPKSPAAWLIQTARRKAIDRLRRTKNFAQKQPEISYLIDLDNMTTAERECEVIPDKRLEMIFTCCHPALAEKTRIALTLRTLGGLTTNEIAHAFLDKPSAMAQRLVRAKDKIKNAAIPYIIPEKAALPERINSVLSVVYLIFNAGYSGSKGDEYLRVNLSDEAIRLARILRELLPDETKVSGLLALLLLHDSRRLARQDAKGAIVSLENQNRNKWDRARIREGTGLLQTTMAKGKIGPYQLQAAISALHVEAKSWTDTDWQQIEALYRALISRQATPVVRINHAMAISYAKTPIEALDYLETFVVEKDVSEYQPYFAVMADLNQRAGNIVDASAHYERAIALADNEAQQDFLRRKRDQM